MSCQLQRGAGLQPSAPRHQPLQQTGALVRGMRRVRCVAAASGWERVQCVCVPGLLHLESVHLIFQMIEPCEGGS